MKRGYKVTINLLLDARDGTLDILSIPQDEWKDTDLCGDSLLHYACRGQNKTVLCKLILHGLGVNDTNHSSLSPIHIAAMHENAEAIEILCAAGANIIQLTTDGRSPMDMCCDLNSLKILIANGVRLGERFAKQEIREFERSVLRCRSIVVSFLCIKKTGQVDYRWCRYLLREVGLEVWASRYDVKWGI